MRQRILIRVSWSLLLLSILMFLPTAVVHADNCGSFSDCFATTDAAATVTVAVAVIIAIALFALPQLLEQPPTTETGAPEQPPSSGGPLPPLPLDPPQEAEEGQAHSRREEDRSTSDMPTGPLSQVPRDSTIPEFPTAPGLRTSGPHMQPQSLPEHLQDARLAPHQHETAHPQQQPADLHDTGGQFYEGNLHPGAQMHAPYPGMPPAPHQQPISPEPLHRQPGMPEAAHRQPGMPEKSQLSSQEAASPAAQSVADEKALHLAHEAQIPRSGEMQVPLAHEAQIQQPGEMQVPLAHEAQIQRPGEMQVPRPGLEAQVPHIAPEAQIARGASEAQIPRSEHAAREALMPAPGLEELFTLSGLHHVTAISGNPQLNLDFYTGLLGLRLVKVSVNFERPTMYQFYYGNAVGQPGTILSFFCQPGTARGSRGTGQVTSLAFAVPEDALPFWTQYLISNGIVVGGPHQRFGSHALSFFDPDGLQVDLVAHKTMETRNIWQNGRIPPVYALRGLYSVSIAVARYELTADLLQQGLGFQQVAQADNRYRYHIGSGQAGTLLDVVHLPSVPAGTMGAGIVHHVGWRTPNEAQQLHWRYRLNNLGLNASPVIDRLYFRACYFRGPGGVLFDIATDAPGFLLDEMPEELGTHLMLPPWLESQRSQLIQALPPLRLPGGGQGR